MDYFQRNLLSYPFFYKCNIKRLFNKTKMQETKLQTCHAIPTGLQILLSDLNFLSQIKRDTKPCCSDHVLVESDSWYGALYRFYKGENRENSISKIEQIVTQTIDSIESHKDSEHIKIIINYFSEAREGIQSLLTVYSNDPKIKAKIKVILDRIDIQLNRFRHMIKGFQTEEKFVNNEPLNQDFVPIDLMDSGVLDLDPKKKPKRGTFRPRVEKND